ncbi:DUF4252 domain-containing protein [Flavobacterium sp. DG1-102-2]|uniref:DUF4252 domain-containing protein n=1 Tax=Flavobacterium sp. DG1-102-2 TaxID=3081663 RepID=UPI0029490BF0|nr:DUF4252 domain-containing protein [Flavobacterium sp. DG1-102-2]MDV6168023.1 DUF4252 domain-containing protein [Flavobacterium sp. DG1-102-2]
MKKFITTVVLAALPFIGFAQTNAFSKFEDVDGIESISINKEMFKMFSSLEDSAKDEKTKSYLDLAGDVESVKVYTTLEKKYKKQLKDAAADYLKVNPLQELVSITDKGSKIKVYVKQGSEESIIKEGLIFIDNDDKKEAAVLVSFTGNINLKDLQDIKDFKGFKGNKGEKGAK